jgi:YVTN family beta-propeller protein
MKLAVVLAVMAGQAAWGADPMLLVVNKHEDNIAYVNPKTLEIVARVQTGHDPHEMVISKDGRFAYVSNYEAPGNTISVIDLVKREHVQQINTDPYTRIHGAAITPDGAFAYFTAGQTGYAVEVDTKTNKVTRGIPTHGKISHYVVLSPDGKRIYTANIETQNVSVIDRVSGDLIAQVPGDKGCEGLQFTPDGKYLWAANQDAGNITIIDAATNKVAETLPCPGMPLRIRFLRDGSRALVSNWVEKGELVVIDVPGRKEIKRLPVGNQPIGVLITPDEKRAFVTSMTSDEVHVINLENLSVEGKFTTGKGCDAMAWWTQPE